MYEPKSLTSHNSVTPFQFEDHAVRVKVDELNQPWFNANDVCEALELGNPRQAVDSHVDSEDVQKMDTLTAGGRQQQNHVNESGLYALIFGSKKDEAKRFKRWVTAEVLPTIRKTGAYSAVAAPVTDQLPIEVASRTFNALHSVGVTIGLQSNVAAISANQATLRLTGNNMLELIGHTHLAAEVQDLILTPTKLGAPYGLSGMAFNKLLAAQGFQTRFADEWKPTDKAAGLYRFEDTGKAHGGGTPILQLKWYSRIIDVLGLKQAA